MEKKEHRRKGERYPVRWKAAVVFDKADGKPVLHTQTHDLSTGGAAIHSEHTDLTGSVISLLLAHPPRRSGETPKMLKIRARVVSTVQTPGKPGYRHGLSFIRTPDDGLDILSEFLKDAAAARAGTEAPATAQPAAAAAPVASRAPAGGSRLEQLRQLAQAKLTEEKKPDPQEELNQRVSDALQRTFQYLKELTEQLNAVKPAYTGKGYAMVGVPEFDGLAWEKGRAEFRAKDVSQGKKLGEQVSLYYRLSGNKQLKLTRDYPASERLKQMLTDHKIEFNTHEKRNDRGSLEQTTFMFSCEVKASVVVSGNFETGKLLLKMRNVERFGMMDYVLAPGAINDASLEELTAFILGETNRIGPLLLKGA